MAVGILWPNAGPYWEPFAKDADMRIGSKCALSQSVGQEKCQKFLNNWKLSEYLVSAAALQVVIWTCHLNSRHLLPPKIVLSSKYKFHVCRKNGRWGGCAVRVHGHDRQGGSSPCVNQQQARAQGHTQHKKVQDGEGGGGGLETAENMQKKLHVLWVLWVCVC